MGTTPAIPLNGEPMKQSMSTDSERTITDIVEDSPAPPVHPLSTPSKKRKLTPESSPDEPLLNEAPTPANETAPQGSEIQNQIAVEKPQIPSRTSKKPKKAPIRRPPQPKKKVPNGQRKPVKPKNKELSMSAGFDDVFPSNKIRLIHRTQQVHQRDSPVSPPPLPQNPPSTAHPADQSNYIVYVANPIRENG